MLSKHSLLYTSSTDLDDIFDDDPMSSLGNLMDVMLVFACGLMIALITHFNVSFTDPTTPEDAERMQLDVEEVPLETMETESAFAQVGVVYKDTETGELYIASQEDLS